MTRKPLIWLSCVLASSLLACAGSQEEKFFDERVGLLNDLAGILEGIEDEDSADEAEDDLEAWADEWDDFNKRYDDWQDEVEESREEALDDLEDRIEDALEGFEDDQAARSAVSDALDGADGLDDWVAFTVSQEQFCEKFAELLGDLAADIDVSDMCPEMWSEIQDECGDRFQEAVACIMAVDDIDNMDHCEDICEREEREED